MSNLIPRYMSKLVDQTIAVISPEQSKSFNWKAQDSSLDAGDDELDDDHGRMFAFQVAQTRDETESVTSRDGFKVFHPLVFFGFVITYWISQGLFKGRHLFQRPHASCFSCGPQAWGFSNGWGDGVRFHDLNLCLGRST